MADQQAPPPPLQTPDRQTPNRQAPPDQQPRTPQLSPSSNTSPPPSIHHQARIAAVIYDATLRGGPAAAPLTAQLSAAYPTAAAIAQQYLAHTHHLRQVAYTQNPTRNFSTSNISHPFPHNAYGAEFQSLNGSFILRRINVSSVAWSCFFIGSLIASMRLCFIFGLACAATLARAAENEIMYNVIDYVAGQSLGEGPPNELYQWLFKFMTDQNPIDLFANTYAHAASRLLPSYISAAILLTPVTAGLICFCLGGLAAISVNFALRVAGGIRFESHQD